jgi:uncharacterized protein YcfJ
MSLAGAAAMALTACSSVDPYASNNYPVSSTSGYTVSSYPAPSYSEAVPAIEYGRVTDVALINGTAAPRGNHAAGTVIGAIVGGLLGHQVGGGTGRAAATVLGAAGGAVAGNQIAQNQAGPYAANQTVYRVSVQTDQGLMRSYDVNASADLRPGDRVRIENGVIYHA